MSYESKEQIFNYHGYTLGVGGYVARQGERFAIAGLTPAALSIAGGRNVVTNGYFSWAPQNEPEPQNGGFRVSVGEATTALWTEETEKEWITYGTVTLQQFNLCDRVRIGTIVSKLTSRHKKNVPDERARISFAGSTLQDIFVDGVRIDADIDHPFDRVESYKQLRGLIERNESLAPNESMDDEACRTWSRSFCKRNLMEEEPDSPLYVKDLVARSKKSPRITRCSVVSGLKGTLPGHIKTHGYSISIEANERRGEFGRIFFGEMVVADGMKRLNMVRWNLGCDNCSDGTAATVDLNGESMP